MSRKNNSFRPCATCTINICRYYRGAEGEKNESIIDKFIREENFRKNGCPYVGKRKK